MQRNQLFLLLLACCFLFTSCAKNIVETGKASYYGPGFDGKKTASGEIFHQNDLTAAHKTIPFGTVVKIKNLSNGKTVKVRINDSGPYAKGRIIDLSTGAAQEINLTQAGVAEVQIKYKKPKKK
jgi:rare lipoprotein A